MAEYKIIYNPYSNDVIIEKAGKVLPKNNRLYAGIKGERLQAWFDPSPGWNGFAQEIFDNNNSSICTIKFVGREIDYIDLENYFSLFTQANNQTEFKLSLEDCKNDSDILKQLDGLVQEAKMEHHLLQRSLQ